MPASTAVPTFPRAMVCQLFLSPSLNWLPCLVGCEPEVLSHLGKYRMIIKGRSGSQRYKFTIGDIGSDKKSIEAAGSDGAQGVASVGQQRFPCWQAGRPDCGHLLLNWALSCWTTLYLSLKRFSNSTTSTLGRTAVMLRMTA